MKSRAEYWSNIRNARERKRVEYKNNRKKRKRGKDMDNFEVRRIAEENKYVQTPVFSSVFPFNADSPFLKFYY